MKKHTSDCSAWTGHKCDCLGKVIKQNPDSGYCSKCNNQLYNGKCSHCITKKEVGETIPVSRKRYNFLREQNEELKNDLLSLCLIIQHSFSANDPNCETALEIFKKHFKEN